MIVPRAISPEILAMFDDVPEAECAAPSSGDRYLLFVDGTPSIRHAVAALHQWSFDRKLKEMLGCPGHNEPPVATEIWLELERAVESLIDTVDDFRDAGDDKIYLVQELFVLRNSLKAAGRDDLAGKIVKGVLKPGQKNLFKQAFEAMVGGDGDTGLGWRNALAKHRCDDVECYTLSRAYYEWCDLRPTILDVIASYKRQLLESYLDHCHYVYRKYRDGDDTVSLLHRFRILIAEQQSKLCDSLDHYNLLSLQELAAIRSELERRFQARVERLLLDRRYPELRALITAERFEEERKSFLSKLPRGRPIGEILAATEPHRDLVPDEYRALESYRSLEQDKLDLARRALADQQPDRASEALDDIGKSLKALPIRIASPAAVGSLRGDIERLKGEMARVSFLREEAERLATVRVFLDQRKPDQAAGALDLVRKRRASAGAMLDSAGLPDLSALESGINQLRQALKREADWKRAVRAHADRGEYEDALKQAAEVPDLGDLATRTELSQGLRQEVADAVKAHVNRDVEAWRAKVRGMVDQGDYARAAKKIDLYEPDRQLIRHYRNLLPEHPVDLVSLRKGLRSDVSAGARKILDTTIGGWRVEVKRLVDIGKFDDARRWTDTLELPAVAKAALDHVDPELRPDLDRLRTELRETLAQAEAAIDEQARALKRENRLIDLLLLAERNSGMAGMAARRQRIDREMRRAPPYDVVQFDGGPVRWFYKDHAVMWQGAHGSGHIPWRIGFISQVAVTFSIAGGKATLGVGRDRPPGHEEPNKEIQPIEIERKGKRGRIYRGESAELGAAGLMCFGGNLALLDYKVFAGRFLILKWRRPDPAIIIDGKPLAKRWPDWEVDVAHAVVIGV